MLLAPLAGYDLTAVDWPALVGILGLGALGLCGLGFAAAWWIDSVAGYHGVMGAVFFPLWALSGAMFPPATAGAVLETAARFDPLSYVGEGVRRALYGGELPAASIGMPGSTVATEFLVVAGFAAASLMLAAAVSRRN